MSMLNTEVFLFIISPHDSKNINNRTERGDIEIFLIISSLHRELFPPRTSTRLCANHMQSIERLSHARCRVPRAAIKFIRI